MESFPRCICGHRRYRIILKDEWVDEIGGLNFWIIGCVSCGLLRTFPVPLKTIDNFEDAKHRIRNQELWKSFGLDILRLIRTYQKNAHAKILDVGCNIGIFVKLAEEYHFDATGIDVDRYAVRVGRDRFGVDLRCQNLEEAKFNQNEFDVVLLSHTLEHVPNPIELLGEINRILKPNGILVVESPNIEGLSVKLQKLRGEPWYGYNPRQHVWHFSPMTIQWLVESAKFKTIELNTKKSMHYEKTGSLWDIPRDVVLKLSGLLGLSDQIILVAIPQK